MRKLAAECKGFYNDYGFPAFAGPLGMSAIQPHSRSILE